MDIMELIRRSSERAALNRTAEPYYTRFGAFGGYGLKTEPDTSNPDEETLQRYLELMREQDQEQQDLALERDAFNHSSSFYSNAQLANQAAKLRQQGQGATLASTLMGERNRAAALGETEGARGAYQGMLDQGGVLSAGQVDRLGARVAGGVKSDVNAAETSAKNTLRQSGQSNPSAVLAAVSRLRSGSLGAGTRARNDAEVTNAQSLPSIVSGASALGQHRAGLQGQTTWEQATTRSPIIKDWAEGRSTAEVDPGENPWLAYQRRLEERNKSSR